MSVLATYTCDGTPGATVTAGGGLSVVGSPVYSASGTAIECNVSGTAQYIQDGTTGDYCAVWFTISALPSGLETLFVAYNGSTALAAIRVDSVGAITLRSGVSSLTATSAYTFTPGSYRFEWHVSSTGQELRIYTATGTTALDDVSGAVSNALGTTMRRFGHPVTGASTGVVDLDQVTINDAWPNAGTPVNTPPTASFTHTETDLTTSVDGTGSSDPDGTIASWDWDWGDSTTHGTGSTSSHTYAAAGTYTVTLTVTDNDGATGTASTSVTVTAPAPVGLVIRITPGDLAATVRGVMVSGALVAASVREVVASGGGTGGGALSQLTWTATSGYTDNGDGSWTSSAPTDNGDGTWTGSPT